MKGTNAMSRKNNAKSNETPSIVLKTIHDDIMRDNANATITTKQMRAKLRVAMNDVHVRNSSWIFTQSQYDVVRSMFDAKYAQRIERANKRNARTNATPRKTRAKSNDIANVDNGETRDVANAE
jgi:hypothetical protein